MLDRMAGRAAFVIILAFAWQAKAYDPCLPAQATGNALIDLTNLLAQPQRDQQCAALRQAQWAAYYAHQKSAQTAQSGRDAKDAETPPAAQSAPETKRLGPLQVITEGFGVWRHVQGAYGAPSRQLYPRSSLP